ncbi:transglycosylase domain-containing protein [Beijerinckia indica]|uniref:Penicillin-binding protein, 1A family n=1 Tax=Beijerinckia indica subsp. indica (strain ATCC 9039 / DSM 1715 / NCIMB 8712) TaxID=395963 RepID=B2IC03_BEII9|nr:PBP1A family penicillin-binding protein [Beijerinckia indica]ACB95258.1 penicillin-binding protein, 1A family [Beijerinckia indica subsp. indica ATCC 9039]
MGTSWFSWLSKTVRRLLLELDAWIDSSLYDAKIRSRETYLAYSAFMERFHVSGWRRILVECSCEGLTLSIAGGLFALFLAIPAFQETSEDWLKKQDLAITFLDRSGAIVGKRGIKHDDSVAFEELPPTLIHAVLATEDRRFFDHFGIDIVGTFRALTVNARASNVVQGGSSITQQLAKNLFLSNQRTLERKIKEAYLALWLETHLSKREILRLYLDRVYMGGGTFGVQAAAQFYFGKSVRDLTLSESAMLAGLFKAPTKYAPHVNLPAARARANDVLTNMVNAGYLGEGQIHAALRNPATPVDRRRDNSPDWYLDYAYDEVKKLVAAGKLGEERVLTVRTALDSNLQKQAETTIEEQLRQRGPDYHVKQSAMVVIEPLGALRAIVGGRDYGASQFNRATDALRQPGSSFKPFVYLTALMSGKFKPSTIVLDAPICIGNWCPRNYGGTYAGHLPLVNALARSLNTVAVRLATAVGDGSPKAGRAKIIDTARRMGLTTPLTDTVSLPIGAAEVTVFDMASAYTTFANGGLRAPAFAAMEIANSRGEIIYRHDSDAPAPVRIVNEDTVIDMDSMLLQVVQAGTGRKAQLEGIDVAGKTGTTNGYKDAWFIGFTGNYVGAIWFGNDDDSPMEKMTGGSLPAATWHEIMAYAHQGIDLKPLPGRPQPVTPAETVAKSGETASADKTQIRPALLSPNGIEVLKAIADTLSQGDKQRLAAGPTIR